MWVYNWPLADYMAHGGAPPTIQPSLLPFLLGRTALNYLIQRERVAHAFLPAFVCPLVVDLYLRHGSRVTLYDHLDVRMDVDDIPLVDALAAHDGARAHLLWVDHWGLGRDVPPAVADACRERGITVVVDALHALPVKAYQADFVLYGCRKLLCQPAGALLYARRWDGPERPVTRPRAGALAWWHARHRIRTLLLARGGARSRLLRLLAGGDFDQDERYATAEHTCPGLLERLASLDLARMASQRRAHFQRLASGLGMRNLLAPDACPLGFPLVNERRDAIRLHLYRREVHTAVIWTRLHPLVDARRHPRACALAQRILVLPCNHDLGEAQIDAVVAGVRDFGHSE